MTNSNIIVTHNIYDYLLTGFEHSLTVTNLTTKESQEGKRVGYQMVARNGIYAATTCFYTELPRIFCIGHATCDMKIRSDKKY